MNKRLFFLILFLSFGVAVLVGFRVFCPGCQAKEEKLSSAPYFVLESLEGNKVTLSDFTGQDVLLVFWATYCGWCAKEKEDLMRFTEEQKGKIEVVVVVNEPKETVLDYAKREGINFAVLVDEGRKTFEKYQLLGTPDHFLINKEGEIVARRSGYASYTDLLMLAESLEER